MEVDVDESVADANAAGSVGSGVIDLRCLPSSTPL
jgi:hypothetical protein